MMWKKVGEGIVVGSLFVILLVAPAYALLFGDRGDIEANEERIEELEERVDVLEDVVYGSLRDQFDVDDPRDYGR